VSGALLFYAKVRAKRSPIVVLYFYLARPKCCRAAQREGVSDTKKGMAHASSSDMSCRVIKRVPLRKVR
jgi:hypothetical protein